MTQEKRRFTVQEALDALNASLTDAEYRAIAVPVIGELVDILQQQPWDDWRDYPVTISRGRKGDTR